MKIKISLKPIQKKHTTKHKTLKQTRDRFDSSSPFIKKIK